MRPKITTSPVPSSVQTFGLTLRPELSSPTRSTHGGIWAYLGCTPAGSAITSYSAILLFSMVKVSASQGLPLDARTAPMSPLIEEQRRTPEREETPDSGVP